jgi:hypothetical protein
VLKYFIIHCCCCSDIHSYVDDRSRIGDSMPIGMRVLFLFIYDELVFEFVHLSGNDGIVPNTIQFNHHHQSTVSSNSSGTNHVAKERIRFVCFHLFFVKTNFF